MVGEFTEYLNSRSFAKVIFLNISLKFPAGNFNEMFKNITLANDLEFKYSVNSPTMMIDGMTVAGK